MVRTVRAVLFACCRFERPISGRPECWTPTRRWFGSFLLGTRVVQCGLRIARTAIVRWERLAIGRAKQQTTGRDRPSGARSSAGSAGSARNRAAASRASTLLTLHAADPGLSSQLAASPTLQISHLALLTRWWVTMLPVATGAAGPQQHRGLPPRLACFPTLPDQMACSPGLDRHHSHHRSTSHFSDSQPATEKRQQCLGCSRIDQPIPGKPHRRYSFFFLSLFPFAVPRGNRVLCCDSLACDAHQPALALERLVSLLARPCRFWQVWVWVNTASSAATTPPSPARARALPPPALRRSS